ncbi:MAG: site-specific integrase [Clostridiales bacterium]|nr:site-specific integrase [Clostridiales bacterium]
MTVKRNTSILTEQEPSDADILDFIAKHPEECLHLRRDDGSIDMDGVETQMKKTRRKQVLESHPYSIYQGSDGRWRTHIKDEEKAEGRKLIVRKSRDDLEDILCDFYLTDHEAQRRLSHTMESLYEEWLEYKALHVASTTIDRTKRCWNKYYAGEDIIRKPIVQITKLDLDIWIHEMIRRHEMKKHQFDNFKSVVRQELDYAVDLEIIESNPFLSVRINTRRMLQPERKKSDKTQIYFKDELTKLQEMAWDEYYKGVYPTHQLTPLAVMFMFLTGIRVGEVCGLRYEDIDDRELTIRRFIRYPGNEVVNHTKGTYGDRTIPLIPQAIHLIETARTRQREKGTPDDGYIFSMREDPILYTSVTKAFTKYCEKMGIITKSSHKARKTFISSLIEGNVNINTVRQYAGHVDERTTLNNYCFDRSTDEEKYVKMEKALA